jgi:ubiquinone/menaquinone biosynthesis C-methylase UbiE
MSGLKSRLQHYAMKNALFSGQRTALIAATQGRVLEICFETDKNIHYYSPWVTDLEIVCLDGAPSAPRHDTNDRGLRVELIFAGSDAAALPFEDGRFDWVVSTLTLCRAKHADAILAEVRRVLKPAGVFLFLEHGRSLDPAMGRWQERLRSLWLNIGGCDLDLEIDRMVEGAGMRIEKLERYQLGQPKFLSTMYRGSARPA